MKTVIKVTEKAFEQQVKHLARVLGYRYYHTWRSIHSPAGFPDCVFVKGPRLIFAELKTEKGTVSPEQQAWLDELSATGVEVYLWRPADFDRIAEVLQGYKYVLVEDSR